MRVVRGCLTGCACLALGLPATALAEGLVVCDDELAAAAEAFARSGIDASRPGPPPAPPRARELIEAAGRSYAEMSVREAQERVAEAAGDLDRTGAQDADRDDLVRLELLGALARAVGRPRPDPDVDAALGRAIALDPGLVVDPVEYPPWLRSRVEELRADLQPTAFELRGEAGAEAWIDGESICRLPCTAPLVPGRHRIRVTLAGWLPFVAVVQVAAEATSIDAILQPDARALASSARAAIDAGRRPDEALAHFDPVVEIHRHPAPGGDSLVATLFRRDGGRRSARAPVGGPETIAAVARRIAETLLAPTVARRPTRRHHRRPGPRWYEHAWLWVGAGAVLVAGGVGLALAVDGGGDDQFVAVVRTP